MKKVDSYKIENGILTRKKITVEYANLISFLRKMNTKQLEKLFRELGMKTTLKISLITTTVAVDYLKGKMENA